MFEQAHQKMISGTKMAGDAWDEMILPFRNELTLRFHSYGIFQFEYSLKDVFSLNFL